MNSQGQEPNPYLQPGYQQSGQASWAAPSRPTGAQAAPPGGQGGPGRRRNSAVIAIVAAVAVVVAAGVTGYFVLGGDDKDKKAESDPTPTATATKPSDDNPRDVDDLKPVVAGWQVVVNPKAGLAYDVPKEWKLKEAGWATWVTDSRDEDETPLVGFMGVANLDEEWCRTADGFTPLGSVGSRPEKSAVTTKQAARDNAEAWVFGAYTQPDRKNIRTSEAESYVTESGLNGSLVTASSDGAKKAKKNEKCATDGMATTFAFEKPDGEFASWTYTGVKGEKGAVPGATVRKILSTVRLLDDPAGS
ncbi:hypothetical protein P8605_40265 [Streptomyces sp. T-3]|nr:hypothetical protein [Streptomyces sp. T-3]